MADTVGELGLFYRLAPIAFLGGSLIPHGGQNPIEPAKLGAAILHGPHVRNFLDVYQSLDEQGGALTVADTSELAGALDRWFQDASLSRAAGRKAHAVVGELTGAADRVMQALDPLLARAALRASRNPA